MWNDKETRNEEVVFRELEQLCGLPGYVHTIAYFCFRDNTFKFSDKLRSEDVLQLFSMEALIRPEISTLIGLTCKNEIDTTLPSPSTFEEYIKKLNRCLRNCIVQ